LKFTSKFLIDFFIKNENYLNNYIEIFSKNLNKISDLNSKFLGKSIFKKDKSEMIGKSREISQSANSSFEFKKFFELNLKKNIFTTDKKNQVLKSKIFTKIVNSILRSKGLTLNYKLLDLDSFSPQNECDEISNNIIEKSIF